MNSKGQTGIAIDLETQRHDQLILAATHSAFGELPIDEKYLPVMRAFLRGAIAEAMEKKLMSILHETLQDGNTALIRAINENRKELSDALREYSKLTDPFNQEVGDE